MFATVSFRIFAGALFPGLLLATGWNSTAADSIEKTAVTPEEVARELGMEMDKFEARFDAPVYATLQLTWKQADSENAQSMQHTSPAPDQYHDILFVRKDFGQMQLKTGGANAKQVRDIIEMNVRFGNTGFFYRDLNPFAKIQAGQSIQSWSKRQSREPLPLDQAIPLVIVAGPQDPGKPMKSLFDEYRTAPAYISLHVTFSKTPPPPAAPVKPAPAAPAPPTPSTK
jgi:hypothetical protein